ncbi:recombination mediator RecR [Dongia sp.]|uniref:recombination mediator RecR n=1 Tax=Dongia sp. TaxID=1977262 RepID=UPI0035AE4BAB
MNDIDKLIQIMGRLPGLGPRSARRAVLHLLKKRETLLHPLIESLGDVAAHVKTCGICGNLDAADPCAICRDAGRDTSQLCVVADVGDLWALERIGTFKGRYQVLGGVLSALDGIGPEQLAIAPLLRRLEGGEVKEVILALGATVDGQTTGHYLADRLQPMGVAVSRLAHGVPVGGELDYLDDGTLIQALKARQKL